MRLVHLSPELDGAVLARAVMDAHGKVLLAAGSQLSKRYIERLQARGVHTVYLADEPTEDVVSDEALRAEARSHAEALVHDSSARASRGERGGLPAGPPQEIMNEIVENLWRHQGLSVDLSEMHRQIPYTFTHSVNVALLSLSLGQAYGLPRAELLLLGTGAMLQDVGIVRYADLIRQPRPLQPDEFIQLQRHTDEGFRYLRDEAGLELLVAHVAYQHHERMDGSGYPRGLVAEEIHVFARIAAVADVYDALVADRPHKAGMPPHEAMSVLRGMGEDKLDMALVRRLSENLAVYATGSPVLLTSGEVGVVMAQGSSGSAFPVVRIVADESLRVLAPRDVDLGADPARRAVKAVLPDYPRIVRRQIDER